MMPDNVTGIPWINSRTYNPYEGDPSQYGYGPEHRFFNRGLGLGDQDLVEEYIRKNIAAEPTENGDGTQGAGSDPLAGVSPTEGGDLSEFIGDIGFGKLGPGRSDLLSFASGAVGGPVGGLMGLSNAALGAHAAGQQMDMMSDVTGRTPSTGSKFGAGLAGATGFTGLSDYGRGLGGYGDIGEGGYVGAMNMMDPGVAGAARGIAREAVDQYAGVTTPTAAEAEAAAASGYYGGGLGDAGGLSGDAESGYSFGGFGYY